MPVIQTNGINLYYEERGTGEPLLLIMGITASGAAWEKHAGYWAKTLGVLLSIIGVWDFQINLPVHILRNKWRMIVQAY